MSTDNSTPKFPRPAADTPKRFTTASEALASGMAPGRVHFMTTAGVYKDDCGILQSPPIVPASAPTSKVGRAEPKPQMMLPRVGDGMRATPNAWLRGALFSAIQGKERVAVFRDHVVPCIDGVDIRVTGWKLDQADLDVWETIVHLMAHVPVGTQMFLATKTILKALGRDTGKSQREWLRDAFVRLASTCVEVKIKGVTTGTYFGALLRGIYDRDHHRFIVDLDPRLFGLYREGWTCIDWHERHQLRRKPLALWLHGWYCSHAQAYDLKVPTLHRICGSANKQMAGFKRDLRQALDDLKVVGAITSWTITPTGLVQVERKPSRSQARHLYRKAKRSRPARSGPVALGQLLKPRSPRKPRA